MSAVVERRKIAKKRDGFRLILAQLQKLESKAHDATLHDVAQELNKCKNAVGWLFAELGLR